MPLIPRRYVGRQLAEGEWARRREKEQRKIEFWSTRKNYYDEYSRNNARFQYWTSPNLYEESMNNYIKQVEDLKKAEEEEKERSRLDLIKHEQKQKEEIAQKEQDKLNRLPIRVRNQLKNNHSDINVLKDINSSLKAEEDYRRRHEAELKLYQQWKMNNPIIQKCEREMQTNNLKLSWLDAQIQKQIEKEKERKELNEFIKERDKRILEEEELKKKEYEMFEEKNKQYNEIVEKQLELLKQKDEISKTLEFEEKLELRYRDDVENLIEKREKELKNLRDYEISLFNLNQYRLRLRRRAKMIEEEIELERKYYENLLQLEIVENDLKNEETKHLRNLMLKTLESIKEQKLIEKQRQDFLTLIFDSEAKNMWEKQESIWQQERKAREDLFMNVIEGLKKQIDEKLEQKLLKQKEISDEKDELIRHIESAKEEMIRFENEKLVKQQNQKYELDRQVIDKEIRKKELEEIERLQREKKLAEMREEEERIRKEIEKLQLNLNTSQRRFPRHSSFW